MLILGDITISIALHTSSPFLLLSIHNSTHTLAVQKQSVKQSDSHLDETAVPCECYNTNIYRPYHIPMHHANHPSLSPMDMQLHCHIPTTQPRYVNIQKNNAQCTRFARFIDCFALVSMAMAHLLPLQFMRHSCLFQNHKIT